MNTLGEFFHMGGYAFYVWGAYGVTFVVLLANAIVPAVKVRHLQRSLVQHTQVGDESQS